jgi:hypothetical protein
MSHSLRHFLRHYAEMVAAMIAGMIVLGLPGEALLRAFGTSSHDLQANAPAVALLGMFAIMTVPMVAWMRFRGHSWRPCHEMAASMLVPTLAAIALLPFADFGTLMGLEHVAMLPSMLLVMLLRYDEYAHSHAHMATA